MSILSKIVRRIAAVAGYRLYKDAVLPFGIDYIRDIQRLSQLRSVPVNMFFDVGAHTGETAALALNNFPGARVLSFEPNPRAYDDLVRAIRSDRFRAFQLGMSNRDGMAAMRRYGVLATCNTLEDEAPVGERQTDARSTIEVPVRMIDSFCAEYGIEAIDVLKIDVEGHDLKVLAGATQMLAHTQMVYVEFNFITAAKRVGTDLNSIAAILEPIGLKFVATYPEFLRIDGEIFVAANALFCR